MRHLVHATALVTGETGIILVGPSGSGKTTIALLLMASALREGHFAAFVSDDQVYLENREGAVVASAPETLRGLAELRGSGIGRVASVDGAAIHFALQPVVPTSQDRIPEQGRTWSPLPGISLPLHFINASAPDPFFWLKCLLSPFPQRPRTP